MANDLPDERGGRRASAFFFAADRVGFLHAGENFCTSYKPGKIVAITGNLLLTLYLHGRSIHAFY